MALVSRIQQSGLDKPDLRDENTELVLLHKWWGKKIPKNEVEATALTAWVG